MDKPLLSIGIIFKNEIRCLERCLQSLIPLRAAIPCELVMADTGATDGSREIAEKYADILIDFPWIDDFSAARNAVMEHCSGEWHFCIDADEWLDKNVTQLVNALKSPLTGYILCAVMIRNYSTQNLSGDYSDFLGVRLIRMSTGARYKGEIHEHFELEEASVYGLGSTILHHDGYVTFSEEQRKAKNERNMKLLRKKLEQNPNDLVTLLQCIESSNGTWEFGAFISQAVKGIEERRPCWNDVGAPILRYAVNFAETVRQSNEEELIKQAQTLFPNSPFTTIDIAYTAFIKYARDEQYEKAISLGEGYLKALDDYRVGCFDVASLTRSTLAMVSRNREYTMRTLLASIYIEEKQFQKAWEILECIELADLDAIAMGNYVGDLLNIHAQSEMDTSQAIANLWNNVHADESKTGTERKIALLSAAAQVFPKEYREAEDTKGYRHAYTAFLSLAEKQYEPGIAAFILESKNSAVIEKKLLEIKNWENFPIHALIHALKCDICFPLPNQLLNVEDMDRLSTRLAKEKEYFFSIVLQSAEKTNPENWKNLLWMRSLILAAIRTYSWSDQQQDSEQGISIAQAFAKIEGEFLPCCYATEVLQEHRLFVLPPIHRFGFYCSQAFAALESGDTTGYVRLLRNGLNVCESTKNMVEFLIEHTPELQMPPPSPEMLALAEQIRAVLSRFNPDDPAVAALKQSEAYQKVAHLIENPVESVTDAAENSSSAIKSSSLAVDKLSKMESDSPTENSSTEGTVPAEEAPTQKLRVISMEKQAGGLLQ